MKPSTILSIVAAHFKVSESVINSKARKSNSLGIRHMYCLLCHDNKVLIENAAYYINTVGAIVKEWVELAGKRMETDSKFRADYIAIQDKLDALCEADLRRRIMNSPEFVNAFIAKNLKAKPELPEPIQTISEYYYYQNKAA